MTQPLNISRLMIVFVIFLSSAFISSTAWSIDAIELESEKDQERFQNLIFELRCPLCQNQNLTDSNSKISVDLRREVVRLLNEEKSDDEIKQHMVSLYGDFILYRPPVQKNTLVLWFGPLVMAALALSIFGVIVFKRSRLANTSTEEDDFLEDEIEDTTDDLEAKGVSEGVNEAPDKDGSEKTKGTDDQNEDPTNA